MSTRGFGVSNANIPQQAKRPKQGKEGYGNRTNPNTAQTNKPFIRIQAERKYK